jgi:hypothetical protein
MRFRCKAHDVEADRGQPVCIFLDIVREFATYNWILF